MKLNEISFQDTFNQFFQSLSINDIKFLNTEIRQLISEKTYYRNYQKSYTDFLKDYNSRATRDKEDAELRLYEYAWEQILLLACLRSPNIVVNNFSFIIKEDGEKDLLITHNNNSYHIEITSKRTIQRASQKKQELIDSDSAQKICKKTKTDNSNILTGSFTKYLQNHFTIPKTNKILFFYNQKGWYSDPEYTRTQLRKLAQEHEFYYVFWNNLNASTGRTNPETGSWNIDCYSALPEEIKKELIPKIQEVLKELKTREDNNEI